MEQPQEPQEQQPPYMQFFSVPVMAQRKFAELVGVTMGVLEGWINRGYTPNGQLFGFPFCENIVKRPETTALNAHDHPRIDRTTTGRTL